MKLKGNSKPSRIETMFRDLSVIERPERIKILQFLDVNPGKHTIKEIYRELNYENEKVLEYDLRLLQAAGLVQNKKESTGPEFSITQKGIELLHALESKEEIKKLYA